MPYRLVNFVDLNDGRPGMLIPIFVYETQNLPFVQECDEYTNVVAMVPFIDMESYPVVATEASIEVSISEQGVIAFRNADGQIFIGRMAELFEMYRDRTDPAFGDPFLNLSILRLVAADKSEHSKALQAAAESVFRQTKHQDAWIHSEESAHLAIQKFWSGREKPSDAGHAESYSGSYDDTARMFRWLSKRANFSAPNWGSTWHRLASLMPFDDPVMELGADWIYSEWQYPGEIVRYKSVLYVVLEFWRGRPDIPFDLSDCLASMFGEHPYLAYELMPSRKLLIRLIEMFEKTGNVGVAMAMVDFLKESVTLDEELSQWFKTISKANSRRSK
jgi:hypothetical protein